MLRDNLVGLIKPMQISAGTDPLALSIQKQASDDRSLCLENPRPEGAESSLTENVTSPFQAEPGQTLKTLLQKGRPFILRPLIGMWDFQPDVTWATFKIVPAVGIYREKETPQSKRAVY